MTRLVIVQPGQKIPALAQVKGDFSDWILAKLGHSADRLHIVRPQLGEPLPAPRASDAIVITGSASMVTDKDPWIATTGNWLRRAVETGCAVLGICFGHQLLAHAMGGEAGDNPQGIEAGTFPIQVTPEARGDGLFGASPASLEVHAAHGQTVLRLPPGAVPLASSAKDAHHAFRIGERAWGMQFHPEFSAPITAGYVRYYATALEQQGEDASQVLNGVRETGAGVRLLRHFGRSAGLLPTTAEMLA
jgi:GMP synthase (glutamine-hydrolysing)